MRSCLFVGLLAALIAFLVDQATKAIVVSNATVLSSGVSVFPGFNLIYLRNDGVTFGLLGGAPWWSLVLLALGICVWLAFMLVRTSSRVEAIAYGAIIGGALGNLVDRIRLGKVVDMILLHTDTWSFAIFNVADTFITIGALNYKYGSEMVATFSNYGKSSVDLFAPGVKIWATTPLNTYEYLQGTSMASPEVAGVAAMIRSYFPSLSAKQVKQILMDSGLSSNANVILGGDPSNQDKFSNISTSGKMANLYNALIMADKMARK